MKMKIIYPSTELATDGTTDDKALYQTSWGGFWKGGMGSAESRLRGRGRGDDDNERKTEAESFTIERVF